MNAQSDPALFHRLADAPCRFFAQCYAPPKGVLKSIQRQKHLDAPTCLARTIGAAALALVRANWDLRQPIRMLTVTALEVSGEDEPEQLSMFEAAAPQKSDEKRERLERSLDAIRRKYGKNSIAAADVLKNDIGLEGIEMEQSAPGEEGETE